MNFADVMLVIRALKINFYLLDKGKPLVVCRRLESYKLIYVKSKCNIYRDVIKVLCVQ